MADQGQNAELMRKMKEQPKSTEEILRERMIFRYHNGNKWCCSDPIELQIALQEQDIDWEKFEKAQKQIEEEESVDTDLLRELVGVLRTVFQIEPVGCDAEGNPTGKTAIEVMDVMVDFLLFTNELKKTEDSNPTLQKFMELESSMSSKTIPTTMEEDSPTEPSANSGSTERELSIDEQRQRSSV